MQFAQVDCNKLINHHLKVCYCVTYGNNRSYDSDITFRQKYTRNVKTLMTKPHNVSETFTTNFVTENCMATLDVWNHALIV